MAKKETIRFITPKGKLNYPWLRVPDVKFNEAGTYKCSIVLSQADAHDLLIKLNEYVEASFVRAKEEAKPQDKPKIQKTVPWKQEYDENGDETGNIILTPKSQFKPSVVDSRNNPLPEDVSPYGGSVGKLAFNVEPYLMASTKTAGITLYLQGAQILELVTGGGGDCGFTAEDGYVAEDEKGAGYTASDMDDAIPFS